MERLEPRILLSGDSLRCTAPDPLQDTLLANTLQVVQCVELLDTADLDGRQLPAERLELSQELSPSDMLETGLCQPLFSLQIDDESTGANPNPDIDPGANNAGPVQSGVDLAVPSDDSQENDASRITAVAIIDAEESTADSTAITSEDDSKPIVNSDADSSIEYATSIEIRGPPADLKDSLTTSDYIAYTISDEIAESSGVECAHTFTAPELPGLQLVDPDISSWNGQIFYLDFDGTRDVIYNGPVTVGPFDVPAFSLDGTAIANQEGALIAEILYQWQRTFVGSGVIFTTERPTQAEHYSSIYIGGDDSAFSAHGSFRGLAEEVDVGNAVLTDNGFVFSGQFFSACSGSSDLVAQLSQTIAHEAGHLLGYEHSTMPDNALQSPILSKVAAAEIRVLGLGISIEDNDTTPSTAGGSDLGTTVVGGTTLISQFQVYNDGDSTLALGPVSVPTGFTLMATPPSLLPPGAWADILLWVDSATPGIWSGDLSFATNDPDENPFNFRITGTVTEAPSLPPAEQFLGGVDSFDLANRKLLFTPSGSGYTFTAWSITALPTDPAGGTALTLGDDDAVSVTLGSGRTVLLYGQSYGSFYVGSNGYLTFTQPDTDYSESLADHFDTPRISVLFDDLNPTAGGQVRWQQLSDRVVVTWQAVPEYGTGGPNTMQVELYFDGRIQLAWLGVASADGIVGLSNGLGLPGGFTETDLSASGV